MVLWQLHQLPSVTEHNATSFMRPISILCNYMFYDVIPHQAMSELCLYMDLTYLAKVLLSCNGLYVMYKGLSLMHEGSVCHMP